MSKNTRCHNFSCMHYQDHQNNIAYTQTMPKTTAMVPKLLSPTGDEYPSCHSLPFLPYDLILEILLRLPVRSLLLFKCVCKSWKTLISDPQFAKDHLCTSIADPNMTHQRFAYDVPHHREIVSFSVQSLLQNPSKPAKPHSFRMSYKYSIVGSCNGLLCLCRFKQGYYRLRLWNPCTGLKSKTLSIGYYVDAITFNGIGYDHVNHRYKLLACVEDCFEHEIQIYSFGSNSCTLIKDQIFPHHLNGKQGKFVSGTLNWIINKDSDDQWVILSLDMVTETFCEVLLPKCDKNGNKIYDPVLGVSHNCLCVCFFDSKREHWSVWKMKEYGVQDSWTKLFMTPNIRFMNRIYYPLLFEPLCISENGVVLLKTMCTNLLMFNSNDRSLRFPKIRGKLGIDMETYHESLVSPMC